MRSDSQPRYIQIHPSDNVAIVVNEGGLPAGTRFESGLVLREAIPEAHKVALRTIPEGARDHSIWRDDRLRSDRDSGRQLGS